MSDKSILTLHNTYNIPLLIATDGGAITKQHNDKLPKGCALVAIGIPGPSDGKSWREVLGKDLTIDEYWHKISAMLQKDLEILQKAIQQHKTELKNSHPTSNTQKVPNVIALKEPNLWIDRQFIPLLI